MNMQTNHHEPPKPIVRVADLCKSFDKQDVLRSINIDFARGECTVVLGPSGCGKSVLLKHLLGLLLPDKGEVWFKDYRIDMLNESELSPIRRQFGFLFQNGALFDSLSVRENVAFPLREHTDLPERLIRHVVLTKLHAVGLRGAARLLPSELSGGMARRVALARAIVMDPKLLIYDEPFSGLDPISTGVVVRLIRHMNDALGISSIVVSHDVNEITAVADRSYLIADGRVIASGSPQQLRADHSELVQQFIHGMPDGPVPFHYPAADYSEQLLARVEE